MLKDLSIKAMSALKCYSFELKDIYRRNEFRFLDFGLSVVTDCPC